MLDKVGLSPGIKEPLCGWQYYEQHKHDIIPYEFVAITPNGTYNVKINNPEYTKKIVESIYRR